MVVWIKFLNSNPGFQESGAPHLIFAQSPADQMLNDAADSEKLILGRQGQELLH